MSKLKIKLTFVINHPYWSVYQLRARKKFLWFTWDDWEYITLVKVSLWEDFIQEFEKHSGKTEVVRDDS